MSRSLYGPVARAFWRSLPGSSLLEAVSHPGVRVLERLRPRQLQGASVIEVIDTLFGPMSRRDAREIVRQIAVNRLRSKCLVRLQRAGAVSGIHSLIRHTGAAGLRDLHAGGPIILGLWHLGPGGMLIPTLHLMGLPVLVIKRTPITVSKQTASAVEHLAIGDPARRAFGLKRALEWLGNGGMVAVAIDGKQRESTLEVPFLGRRCEVGRGAAVLSRLSGAPIVPVVKTWVRDGTIDFRSFEPLPRPSGQGLSADAFDRALTLDAVRWFERFQRAEPGSLRVTALPGLWQAPPWEDGTGTRASTSSPQGEPVILRQAQDERG